MIDFSHGDPESMTPVERAIFEQAGDCIDPDYCVERRLEDHFSRDTSVDPDWDDTGVAQGQYVALDPGYDQSMRDLRECYDEAQVAVARFLLAKERMFDAYDRADTAVFNMLSSAIGFRCIDSLTPSEITDKKS